MNPPESQPTERTYHLSEETVARFESLVSPEQRDELITQLIEHWLEEQRLAELRGRIAEAFEDEENQRASHNSGREGLPPATDPWSQPDDDWSDIIAKLD